MSRVNPTQERAVSESDYMIMSKEEFDAIGKRVEAEYAEQSRRAACFDDLVAALERAKGVLEAYQISVPREVTAALAKAREVRK